jgi:hypothetical protein
MPLRADAPSFKTFIYGKSNICIIREIYEIFVIYTTQYLQLMLIQLMLIKVHTKGKSES